MLLLLQNVLYCILFILPVKLAVKTDGMNCLYFYPKAYIEEAQRRGLADKDATIADKDATIASQHAELIALKKQYGLL